MKTNQKGFAHLTLILAVIVVLGGIIGIGYKVHQHSNKANAVKNPAAIARKKTALSSATPAATPLTTTTSTGTTSTKTGTSKTNSSSSTSGGSSAPAASSNNSSPAPSSTCSAQGLKFLTYLGCISPASLYNVKAPPASSQQPSLAGYACIQYVDSSTAYVQLLSTLSYSVSSPQNWYADLDLSSSASSDNVVSSKTATYGYYTNNWQVGSSTLQQSVIKSDNFNPGVVYNFYIWAYGSYGNTVLNVINSHPDVTSLQSCS